MAAIPGSTDAPGGDGPNVRIRPFLIPLDEIDRIYGWEPGGPEDPNVRVTPKRRTREWRAVNPRCNCMVPFELNTHLGPEYLDASTYGERMDLAHKLCPRYGKFWRKNGRCRTNPKLPGYEKVTVPRFTIRPNGKSRSRY